MISEYDMRVMATGKRSVWASDQANGLVNPVAKNLRVNRPKVVPAKKGRGSYRRKGRS